MYFSEFHHNLLHPKLLHLKKVLAAMLISLALATAVLAPVPGGLSGQGLKIQAPVQREPLLLGAKLGRSQRADVKIIVWFPQIDQAEAKALLPADWPWQIRTEASPQTRKALSAVSQRQITATEEAGLLAGYLSLAATVKAWQGQVYLEERVHEGLDIERYFTSADIKPVQWAQVGATTSITGYRVGYGEPVQAGADAVNVQVLSRMNGQGGETLLAMPVLLTEF